MKVGQIGDTDIASRRFSGHNLAKSLREHGVEAEHLIWLKSQDDGHTFEISNDFEQRVILREYLFNLNKYYSTDSLFYPFSYGLLLDKQFLSCDVLHLHLIHAHFFDISHLPIISRVKPVVWTLHDLWPIQGHCVHPLSCDRWMHGCGDCPDLSLSFEIQQDTSALNWEYKKLIFSTCEMDLIVSTQWMYDRILSSGFFPKSEIHLVRFGLDLSIFRPLDNPQSIRKKLGIPENNVVLAFRANNWVFKGFKYIKECLKKLSTDVPITLIVFDEKGLLADFKDRYQIIEVQWVEDENDLVKLYNAMDIFLMPSVAESFGMMAIEGMACGKPVIVMDNTTLPEVVKPEESGCIVVKQGDVDQLTCELEKLIANPDLRLEIGTRARNTAEKYYSDEDYVKKIINIYESAITRKKDDHRSRYIIDQLNKIISTPTYKPPVFNLSSVINVYPNPESASEITRTEGISISTIEFKLLTFILRLERTRIMQIFIMKIIKPVYKRFQKLFRTVKI